MAVTTKIRVELSATHTPTVDLGNASRTGLVSVAIALADGVGAGQADRVWFDSGTLAASANVDLDLAGGLTDAFGAAITFVKVKAVALKAAAANTNNIIFGGAATNAWATWAGAATHTVPVRPGGVLAFAVGTGDLTGYGVTAGTGDLLRLANSGAGTSVSYDIAIVGTSA